MRRGNDDSRRGSGDSRRGSGDATMRRGNNDSRNGARYERDRDRTSSQRQSREESLRRGNDSRNRTYTHNDSRYYERYRGQRPQHYSGRISRMSRYNDGYRVWVVGAPYPFYIPASYYHRNRFRVGLYISLGGWYNPLGYYDYYDGYRDGYYDSYDRYDNRSYSRGELRGIVESVDSNRRSFVLRNEETGSFVTIFPRATRVYVRPGDYVEVDGTWSRNGTFTSYDIDWLDRDRADRDDRYDDRY